METKRTLTESRVWQLATALTFLGIGSLIMLVFSPWHPMLDRRADYIGRIILVLVLGTVVGYARRKQISSRYTQVLIGLLILSVAVSLDFFAGIYLTSYLGVTDNAPAGWAIQKFHEFFVIVSIVVLLNRANGGSLGSIYIQRGNLRLGLTIGVIFFLAAAAGAIPMAILFKAEGLTVSRVIPWLPWVLIFVFSNGTMEEVLFRGLFLRKLGPIFGNFTSNFLIAVVFTLLHGLTSYSADNAIFLAVLFPLALLWGWLMQKTDSLWASALFHAGMDIPIILGIFANL